MATARRVSVPAIPRGESTRRSIIDAAEMLFAQRGINGVSLRTIVTEAGVNTAAIHYHFGSKEQLIEAVFAPRAIPIAKARLKLLKACEAAPGRPPLLEQIIHAFVAPTMRGRHTKEYSRLRASMVADASPFIASLFGKYFDASTSRFLAAIVEAAPGLPERDVYWRFPAMLGVVVYPLANPGRMNHLTDGAFDPSDLEAALAQLVPVLARMFCAPPSAISSTITTENKDTTDHGQPE